MIAALGLISAVIYGASDFFGGLNPERLEDASTFPAVIAELIRRGWSQENLAKLASGNMLRVMRSVASAAAR